MRLQTKLTVAFAAVALLPIAALATVARIVVSERYRGEFAHSLEAKADHVSDEYRRLASDVEQATERLANTDDRLVQPILLQLAKGPHLDDDAAQAVAARVHAGMRALGFDILEIVDERGEVLAAGHFAGRIGESDPEALAVARRTPGKARLVKEQILDGGRARTVLALEAAREVQGRFGDRTPRVVVIGGRIVGEAFVARLDPSARLYAADGSVVGERAPAPPKSWRRRVVELPGPDGQAAARVEIAVADDELAEALAWIAWASAALAAAGVVLALLFGALVARRITEPLRELADGARAVAKGSLETSVPVRTRDEVGELASTFNGMTRDLTTAREELVRAERVAAWREIAQRIAHEIKNPLTPIQMAIETLQRAHRKGAPQFDELFGESAQTILDEVGRLKRIVAEFSAFARMPQPTLAPVDVSEIVDAALALYKGGETALELSLPRDLPRALADKEQLTQVVINLVENARDAVGAGAGGRIRVSTRALDGRVELEVADDGPGLSEEARTKLFTPYFTTKARGTGLGLAIVHRIVSDHGGEIRVGAAAGRGAVFTVALQKV
ncbi:MAG: integral rane sensor signal transduction histidine kinase [Myxococcales bacterium]|nr:integral rane sensor signal transduction histidine kinase [Myxococcales bacterium]